MTWAVHNLHTPPVEVIEDGAARFYQVDVGAPRLLLGSPLHFAGSKAEALHWQECQIRDDLIRRADFGGPEGAAFCAQVQQWIEDGQPLIFVRNELSKRGL